MLTVPEQAAPLKADSELRYIGRPMPRVDLRAKVLGQATYGIDVRLPGMAYGAVAHPPTVEGETQTRGRLAGPSPRRAWSRSSSTRRAGFAGVVAESREQAYAALGALDLTWDAGHLWQQAEVEKAVTAGGAGGVVIQDEGAVPGRLRGRAAVEAEYRVPMAYHAHFEPLTAVADVTAGAARIYTSTQAAVSVRGDVAEALGLKPEAVVVSQPYLGAGLGHKVETKAAVEAARLAQAAGRPVHLVWSRAEDFRNSFVRPPHAPHLAGQPHNGRSHRSAGARTGQRQGGAALPARHRRRRAGARLWRLATARASATTSPTARPSPGWPTCPS